MMGKNHEIYAKSNAIMTRGYAILSMCILHLFCRLGTDVYGTPLIWLTAEKPLVYLFGFFSEICVPTYSMCAGYALAMQESYRGGRLSFKDKFPKVKTLLINYWIILVLFSVIGIVCGRASIIPKDLPTFLQSIVLLKSYNGAWWYLNTYIIILLIPTVVSLMPVHKLSFKSGLIVCYGIDVAWYLIGRFNLLPEVNTSTVIGFILKEVFNLINVLLYLWIGGLTYKYDVFDKCDKWLNSKIQHNKKQLILLTILVIEFLIVSILGKAVFVGAAAILTFLIFNLVKKLNGLNRAFCF